MRFARQHLRFWFASVCNHVIGQRELCLGGRRVGGDSDSRNGSWKLVPKMGSKNGSQKWTQKWGPKMDPKMGPKSGSLFKFNTNPVFESYFQRLFLNLILGPIFLRNIYECSMIFARYHLRFWFASVCSHVIGQREPGRTLLAWQVCLPFLDPKNKTRGLRNLELRRMSDMFCHSFLLLPCVTSGLKAARL